MCDKRTHDSIIPPLQKVRNDEKTIAMISLSIQSMLIKLMSRSFCNKKIKKSVTFSKRVQKKIIPHINDMKKEMDINDIWYSEEDISKIRFKCKTIINHMNNAINETTIDDIHNNNYSKQQQLQEEGEQLQRQQQQQQQSTTIMMNDKNICTRGLEKYRTIERENIQIRRSNVIQSVLDEQDFQWSLGINEPEILASVSTLNSYESRRLAYSIAIEDSKHINNIQ